jgi:serine/threonine protein phosphatase PrpC
MPLQPGDTLLMCTDGLSGLVSNQEFQEAANGNPLDQACKQLIELAKSRGGHDNITVQLIRVASDNMRKTIIPDEVVVVPEPPPEADAEKDSEA